MPASITWKTVITSSSILSLALVGDALIYAVLPVHAEIFGIGLIWVGVLLSANRFVRVFAYGWVAVFAQRFGIRRICIAALLAAIVSTAIGDLARMHAWRDVGAAVGPLATGVLLTVTSAELLHGGVGAVVIAGMLAPRRPDATPRDRWRRQRARAPNRF